MLRKLSYVAISTVILATHGPILAGDSPNTTFSIAKAARVPGVTLKAGSYTIRVVDQLPDRYILEIRDTKHTAPLTTFLAIPDESLPNGGRGAPIYWSKSGRTPAMRGMRVSGASTAAVFVFPKADAAKLAQSAGQPVPAVDPDSEGKKEVGKMNDSDRQIVTLWLLSAVAITPEGKETGLQATKFVPSAQAGAAMARTDKSTNAVARVDDPISLQAPAVATKLPAKMPKTAGTSGNYMLAGVLLLGAGTLLAKHYASSGSNRAA